MSLTLSKILGENIEQNNLRTINDFFENVSANKNKIYITDKFIFKPTAKIVMNNHINKNIKYPMNHGFAVLLPTIASMSAHLVVISTRQGTQSIEDLEKVKFKKSDFTKISSEQMWSELNNLTKDDILTDDPQKAPITVKTINDFLDNPQYYGRTHSINTLLFILRLYLKDTKSIIKTF